MNALLRIVLISWVISSLLTVAVFAKPRTLPNARNASFSLAVTCSRACTTQFNSAQLACRLGTPPKAITGNATNTTNTTVTQTTPPRSKGAIGKCVEAAAKAKNACKKACRK